MISLTLSDKELAVLTALQAAEARLAAAVALGLPPQALRAYQEEADAAFYATLSR